jgi:hypothetical protein
MTPTGRKITAGTDVGLATSTMGAALRPQGMPSRTVSRFGVSIPRFLAKGSSAWPWNKNSRYQLHC